MKPVPAIFTKDNPVTKRELWACFRRSLRGFATVQVDDAHAIIGLNAPRYLERKEYLVKHTAAGGDFYKLTPLGEEWLASGIKAYAKNHPAVAGSIPFLDDSKVPGRRVRTRR